MSGRDLLFDNSCLFGTAFSKGSHLRSNIELDFGKLAPYRWFAREKANGFALVVHVDVALVEIITTPNYSLKSTVHICFSKYQI